MKLARTTKPGQKCGLGIVVIILAAFPVFADEIFLRGGGRITGEITARTEESVTVDIGGGATITARMSSIVGIEESISPLQEYRALAASIPAGDAEGWRELARWATNRTLSSQGLKAYSQVVAILPDDGEANRALGRVQLGGKWVTREESYLAPGSLMFEREWMMPGERHAILAERQARESADRQAIDREIRAIEAQQKEAKKIEDAEREKALRGNMPQLGDPVFWGWGAGPRRWPAPSQSWPQNPIDRQTGN